MTSAMFPDEADLVESLVNEMFTEIPIARALSKGNTQFRTCFGWLVFGISALVAQLREATEPLETPRREPQ